MHGIVTRFNFAHYIEVLAAFVIRRFIILGSYCITHLDHDAAFVVTQRHVVGALATRDRSNPFQAVIQGTLQAVRVGVPDTDGACE